jgi:hypothetical protein
VSSLREAGLTAPPENRTGDARARSRPRARKRHLLNLPESRSPEMPYSIPPSHAKNITKSFFFATFAKSLASLAVKSF